ncbi:MAG: ABC transporter ATP-binding protein [Gemmatimonadales bacterium]|jgi:iron complex transport system ATP-binding protein
MSAAIEFRDVRARYAGSPGLAVAGVTFAAQSGSITAVTGPNGSGKSTLVKALLRRVPLTGGDIAIAGVSLGQMSLRDAARRAAVVPQREEPAFPMTVREYIALGRFPHAGAWTSVWSTSDPGGDRAVTAAVERAGVGEFLDRHTDALSGGEWQRVRIARALAQGGRLLVLDEPTTFLDVGHEMAVFELLAELARDGMGVLLITHQLNLVARFAQHVVLLHAGVIAAQGPPAAVMTGGILERVYDWPLVVARDPAVGAPMLIPLRAPAPVTVHRPMET